MAENPFPGMNPYLEQRWGDVHTRLVSYCADLIQEKLPSDLRARMQERVFVESEGVALRAIVPDVHVYGGLRPSSASAGATATLEMAEPILIHLPPVEVEEAFIEIIDARSGGKVVTIIEFVSLANKVGGTGRRLYRQKQTESKRAKVNLVEIDLLRAGKPVTLSRPKWVPLPSLPPYHASIWRAAKPDQLEYYAFPLRRPLPKIPVPLRAKDADIALDVQELVNLAYRRGRYDDIDYSLPPEPPFEGDDARWIEAFHRI
jgi:hypothetical protein